MGRRVGGALPPGGRGCGGAGAGPFGWAGLGHVLRVEGGESFRRAVPKVHPTPMSTPGLACNGSFDMYVCWDYASPNATASASCPWYLPWHRRGEVPPWTLP